LSDLKSFIRSIPDFPKPGILFRDITTLLKDSGAFKKAIEDLAGQFKNKGIKKVVGIESRGFLAAAPVAYLIGAGFVPVRKKGKLPHQTASVSYDLEYGQDTLEIHLDAIAKGEKTIIIDDLLATGGTAKATSDLVKKVGGEVAGLGFLIELSALKGRDKLRGANVFSLMSF